MKKIILSLAAMFVAAALTTALAQDSADGGAMLAGGDGDPSALYKGVPTAGGNAVEGAGINGIVPEPSTVALLCSAVGLVLLRRR